MPPAGYEAAGDLQRQRIPRVSAPILAEYVSRNLVEQQDRGARPQRVAQELASRTRAQHREVAGKAPRHFGVDR
jgi:hypothetical protein